MSFALCSTCGTGIVHLKFPVFLHALRICCCSGGPFFPLVVQLWHGKFGQFVKQERG